MRAVRVSTAAMARRFATRKCTSVSSGSPQLAAMMPLIVMNATVASTTANSVRVEARPRVNE
jgi:hypothetical protein